MQRTSARKTRRQREQGLAEGSFKWTRLGAVFGGVAILVAIGIGVATIAASSKEDKGRPVGIVVNAVPHETDVIGLCCSDRVQSCERSTRYSLGPA
jgi:hypothetical protein